MFVIVIVPRNAFGIVVTLWTKAQLIPVCLSIYGKKTSKCKIKCVKNILKQYLLKIIIHLTHNQYNTYSAVP